MPMCVRRKDSGRPPCNPFPAVKKTIVRRRLCCGHPSKRLSRGNASEIWSERWPLPADPVDDLSDCLAVADSVLFGYSGTRWCGRQDRYIGQSNSNDPVRTSARIRPFLPQSSTAGGSVSGHPVRHAAGRHQPFQSDQESSSVDGDPHGRSARSVLPSALS